MRAQRGMGLGGLPGTMNAGLGAGLGMAASPRLPGGGPLHMRDHGLGVEPQQASKNLMDILGKSPAARGFTLPQGALHTPWSGS